MRTLHTLSIAALMATIISCLLPQSYLRAQDQNQGQNPDNTRFSPREFSIPPSPVFDLMSITPSQVNKISDIKDFKVDWSFKTWRLNPNLALQAQPIWEIMYNRKSISKYYRASQLMRRLASIDVSLGTIVNEDNDRRLGYAVKMNLFRQRDPLLQQEVYEGIDERYEQEERELTTKLKDLNHQIDTSNSVLERAAIRSQLRQTEEQLLGLAMRRRNEVSQRARAYTEEYWNAGYLDFAYGRVNTYQVDSAGRLKTLRLNRNSGWAMWLNGGWGIGRRLFVAGLIRNSWYEEQLDFQIRNLSTGGMVVQKAVTQNSLLSTGLSLRYGGPIYNFFLEFFYERKKLNTTDEALKEAFTNPAGFEVVGTSVKWTAVNPNNITFGGDWRINRNVAINYGIRSIFDENWKFTSMQPVVTVSCMMR
ncbi:MAG: hypothetical protein EBZ67_07870 [Chitinophagia bacterium]|nr:hypothetical protein [Chitinophagia bacterium]